MKNTGEYNEILVKLRLIQLRDQKKSIKINGSYTKIDSVGMYGIEYSSLPTKIATKDDLQALSNAEIDNIATKCGATKSKTRDKADVMINGEGYSIKSLQTAPPALVNHTTRPGWENVCTQVGVSIKQLDTIIDKYWNLRTSGDIKEDVSNGLPTSPFHAHKNYLKPILNYFLFTGSGSGKSSNPAKYMLDIENPVNEDTWTIYGKDFLDKNFHWEKLIFSVRSKKGMGNYPNIKDANKKQSIEKWTKLHQGSHRGALHVSLGK